MNDPVRVIAADERHEITVERAYAEEHDLEVLDPTTPEGQVFAKGRLRGPSRRGGRPLKDLVSLAPVIDVSTYVEFDPTTATVGEVNDYLADADDDERARVLAAETDGQNRKGVVEGPHAQS